MMGSIAPNVRVVEELFRAHHGWLRGWVSRRARTLCADDVASEVFLRLLRLTYVDELREPRAMISTIAARVIGELRRRSALRRALESALAESSALEPSPEERAVMSEALRAIDAILATLPPKARAAFLLSRVDGLTQQEIARRLGVSTRTVERYLADGMRRALAMREDT